MGNATRKQIEVLRKMGYAVKDDLTFEEASALFDKHNSGKDDFVPVEKVVSERKEFHLTPEQVRFNALDIVLRRYPQLDTPGLIREAETIEKWMLR